MYSYFVNIEFIFAYNASITPKYEVLIYWSLTNIIFWGDLYKSFTTHTLSIGLVLILSYTIHALDINQIILLNSHG